MLSAKLKRWKLSGFAFLLGAFPVLSHAASVKGWDEVDGWAQEDMRSVSELVRVDCDRFDALPKEMRLGEGRVYSKFRHPQDWSKICADYRLQGFADGDFEGKSDAFREWFQTRFEPVSYARKLDIRYYYEPTVAASPVKSGEYVFPIYRRPAELLLKDDYWSNFTQWIGGSETGDLHPYYTRKQIDDGALSGRGLELAWLKSPVDVYRLQIMGGGRLKMPSGTMRRVEYDGRNGHEPQSLIRIINQNYQANVRDEFGLENWLNAHPTETFKVLDANPDYAFFKESDQNFLIGQHGAFLNALLPARSIAVNPHYVPLGGFLWISHAMPDGRGDRVGWNHLTLASDIDMSLAQSDGAGAVALYLGWGREIEDIARKAPHMMRFDREILAFVPRKRF